MNKFTRFMKKQGYYILLVMCILLVATVITLSVVMSQRTTDTPTINVPKDPDTPGGQTPGGEDTLKFSLPVAASAIENYDKLYKTGNTSSKHYGVDFKVAEGTKVYSSYTGTVTAMKTTAAEGLVLTIKYDNGYSATYRGLNKDAKLDNNVVLKVGSQVKGAQHIGSVGKVTHVCGCTEEGVTLHMEMRKISDTNATNYVNPMNIFEAQEEK